MKDTPKELKDALVVATKNLNECLAWRAEMDKQRAINDANIVRWKQLVDCLGTVCSDEDEDPSDVEVSAFVEGKSGKQTVKFTDGVRMVLKENRDVIVTAPDIRHGLLNLGFDFSKYSQQLTPIHNCLKRLEAQGEVKPKKLPDGQILGYTWISPIERALGEENAYYAATGEGINQLKPFGIGPNHPLRKSRNAGFYEALAEMTTPDKEKKGNK